MKIGFSGEKRVVVSIDELRDKIREYIGINHKIAEPAYSVINEQDCGEYTRKLICYKGSENDETPAYLLVPKGEGVFPAILVPSITARDIWARARSAGLRAILCRPSEQNWPGRVLSCLPLTRYALKTEGPIRRELSRMKRTISLIIIMKCVTAFFREAL